MTTPAGGPPQRVRVTSSRRGATPMHARAGSARPRRADRARRRLPRRPDAGPAAALASRSSRSPSSASPPCRSRSPWCPPPAPSPSWGMPFPWLVLGIAVYPAAWFLARWYTRQAERIEQDFAEVVDASVNYTLSIISVALVCLTTLVVGGLGLRLSRRTSDFYVAGAPSRRASTRRRSAASTFPPQLSRRRRADLRPGRRHAVAAGRLHPGLPRAARRRGRPDAPLGRLHAARLRRGPARVARHPARLVAARRRHRLALPRAAVPGREPDPDPRHRRPGLGRWVRGHGRRRRRRGRRRHAVDHLRAGRAVLDQAHRPGGAGVRAARAVVPVGSPATAGRPVVEHPAVPHRPRRPPDLPHASTVLALCLGTMGLPHVLVRYYTNPDGIGARRTTVTVIALLGVFYLLPPIYGASAGRLPDPPAGGRLRHHRAAAARDAAPRAGRPAAHGDARRGRVRGVPVHGIRAGHVGRPGSSTRRCCGRGSPGSREATCPASGASGSPRSWRSSSRTPSAGPPSRSAWPPPSAWPSPWPRRPSRRCSCSASGGGGSRRGGDGRAGRRRHVGDPRDRLDDRHRPGGRLDRRPARQPGDVGDPARDRHRGDRLAGHAVADPRRHDPHHGAAAHPGARGPGPLPRPATDPTLSHRCGKLPAPGEKLGRRPDAGQPTASRAATNASTQARTSACECAADSCTRIRALPRAPPGS